MLYCFRNRFSPPTYGLYTCKEFSAHCTISSYVVFQNIVIIAVLIAGRPGSSEVPRNPLTRWDVSSIPANGIFLTKKTKKQNKNAQRVEKD